MSIGEVWLEVLGLDDEARLKERCIHIPGGCLEGKKER